MSNQVEILLMDHLWGNPKGDWQYPITPSLISPPNGYTYSFNHNNHYILLPDTTSIFSVFSVGSLKPDLLGLEIPGALGWVSFSSVMTTLNMYASCYTIEGLNLLRSDVYYRFNESKELIIAVRWNSNFNINYSTLSSITIRFYIPEYLNQVKAIYSGSFDILSLNITNTDMLNQITTFSNQYNNQVSIFANGYYTNLSNVQLDQSVDIIYSPIYKSSYSIPLNNLPIYYSDIDNLWKCLFHIHPSVIGELEFISNIDFYFIMDTGTIQQGLYIDRNNISNIRNVTYHDYGISTSIIETLMSNINITNSSYTYTILANIHKSAFSGDMINSSKELLSLYKLDNTPIQSVLAGINANSIYNATDLEKSSVMQYVQSGYSELSNFDLLEIGGYGSIAKLIGSPLVNVENQWIDVPTAYYQYYTAFEYINNLFTIFNTNYGNPKYQTINPNTTYVEFINGESTNDYNNIYIKWGNSDYTIPNNLDYRVYALVNNVYTDVTSNINITSDSNNTILSFNYEYQDVYIKTSQYIFIQDGYYSPNLNGLVVTINDPMMSNIPYGVVDVFVNGYYLVNNKDYILTGNTIYIINFNYINSNSTTVLVRCYSFCNTDMSMLDNTENFYIENNSSSNLTLLSLYSQYYNPIVMIVNNQIWTQQSFNDPYLYVTIKSYPVSLRVNYNQDTVTMFNNNLKTRKLIRNINGTFQDTPVVSTNKVRLLSVFLSTVLYNALLGDYDEFIDNGYIVPDIGQYLSSLVSQFSGIDPLFNNDITASQYCIIGVYTINTPNIPLRIYDFFYNVMVFFNTPKLDIPITLSYLQKVL